MTDEQKESVILNNCVYDYEYKEYRDTSKEEFQRIYAEIEQQLKKIDSKYCDPLFIKLIAIVNTCDVATKEVIEDRFKQYQEAKEFLETEEAEEIYSNYGIVIPKIYGKYSINSLENWKKRIVEDTLIQAEGYSTENAELKEDLQEIINQKWKDKSQMITPEKLNEETKKDDEINFKYFLFCEEYLKTGKIKKTCEVLGIGRTTAFNYMKSKEVQDYLQKRKKEIQEENEENRKQAFNECFEILQDMFEKDYIDNNEKIKAIDTYLKHYSNIFIKDKKNEVQE